MTPTEEQFNDAYKAYCEQVQEILDGLLPDAGDGTLDGSQWCEINNISERVFTDAIETMDEATYGISPMYPFREP